VSHDSPKDGIHSPHLGSGHLSSATSAENSPIRTIITPTVVIQSFDSQSSLCSDPSQPTIYKITNRTDAYINENEGDYCDSSPTETTFVKYPCRNGNKCLKEVLYKNPPTCYVGKDECESLL